MSRKFEKARSAGAGKDSARGGSNQPRKGLSGPGRTIQGLIRYAEGQPSPSQLARYFPETPNNYYLMPDVASEEKTK